VAALVWLKDNIGGFGGDSNRITLSGHGTGAALVNLLMISPQATGKLKNQFFSFLAAMMSGLGPMSRNDFWHELCWGLLFFHKGRSV
jgi:carboxylesterase type B